MKTIFEKDLSGEIVSPNEPGYEALITDIFATIRTATEMNTGYRTPEEVHEYMSRILGKPLEESTTVLPPLYIDYGKPVTIGKGCFIQQCCTFFGRGGITIGVAMQVAAISPKYTSRDEVSKDYIEHETEILKVQAMNENPDKPENIIEKMIVGRLNKELKEVCLLDQAYVKAEDGKQAVGKYVEQVAKANGANVTIKGFVRFETGEGIEKKEEDFAAEVAAQLK